MLSHTVLSAQMFKQVTWEQLHGHGPRRLYPMEFKYEDHPCLASLVLISGLDVHFALHQDNHGQFHCSLKHLLNEVWGATRQQVENEIHPSGAHSCVGLALVSFHPPLHHLDYAHASQE